MTHPADNSPSHQPDARRSIWIPVIAYQRVRDASIAAGVPMAAVLEAVDLQIWMRAAALAANRLRLQRAEPAESH